MLAYNFEIAYKPGCDKAAHALSRPGGWLADEELMAISSPLLLDLNVIQQEIDEDESLRKIKDKMCLPETSRKRIFRGKEVVLSKGNRSPMQFFTEKQFSGRISFLSLRQPLRSGKDPQTVGC